jgi:3'-phosphoadenosine 5'-phosphosulfate (PAPS) 3'-phosphatase
MLPLDMAYADELRVAIAAAGRAAAEVASRQANLTHGVKDDGSIVTDADLVAAGLIRAEIGDAFPDDAILTEEDAAETDRLGKPRCWLVDPIDGTQSYAEGSDEYDVLIGLSLGGRVAVGWPSPRLKVVGHGFDTRLGATGPGLGWTQRFPGIL